MLKSRALPGPSPGAPGCKTHNYDILERLEASEANARDNEAGWFRVKGLEADVIILERQMKEMFDQMREKDSQIRELQDKLKAKDAEIVALRSAPRKVSDKVVMINNPTFSEVVSLPTTAHAKPQLDTKPTIQSDGVDPADIDLCKRSFTVCGPLIPLIQKEAGILSSFDQVKETAAKIKRVDYDDDKMKAAVCSWLENQVCCTNSAAHLERITMLHPNKVLIICAAEDAKDLLEEVLLGEFALMSCSLPQDMPTEERNALRLFIEPALTQSQKAIRASLVPTYREFKANPSKYGLSGVRLVNEDLHIRLTGSNRFVAYSGGLGYVHPDSPGIMKDKPPPISLRRSARSPDWLDEKVKSAKLRKGGADNTPMDFTEAMKRLL
jgi:hypothetical protein